MPDIVLAGATYPDVPSVILPKSGGGTAQFYDMSKNCSWMGLNAEKISDPLYSTTFKLSDTNYLTVEHTTSAKSILATTNRTTFVPDLSKYEYMIEWLWYTTMVYNDDQVYKACVERTYGAGYQLIMRRPYGLQNFVDQNWAYNYCTTDYSSCMYTIYWNTSGTKTWSTSGYAPYLSSITAATLSSTSSNTPTVTVKRPVFSIKCHDSYFTVDNSNNVDTDKSTIKLIANLYRVDKNTSNLHYQWATACNMYNNPL